MIVFVAVLILWIISLCLHEYAHARVAFEGGDVTVAEKGYLSMNPLAYMSPINSIVLPIVFLLIGGLALPGGAVWIDRSRLRSRKWETGVSLAGPAANVVLAVLLAVPFMFGLSTSSVPPAVVQSLAFACYLQIIAAVLNLLPVPGLDGYGALEPWLPFSVVRALQPYAGYGVFILLILFLSTGFGSWLFGTVGGSAVQALGVPIEDVAAGWSAFRFWA